VSNVDTFYYMNDIKLVYRCSWGT